MKESLPVAGTRTVASATAAETVRPKCPNSPQDRKPCAGVCYRPRLVRFKHSRGARVLIAAGLVAASSATVIAGSAASQESLDELKSRMSEIQGELNAA